jgi:hypothetical protein
MAAAMSRQHRSKGELALGGLAKLREDEAAVVQHSV